MWTATTRRDSELSQAQALNETTCYQRCAQAYARRRSGNDWKRVSHNQRLSYNEQEDCYIHWHYRTPTVRIYRDKYYVTTGGWDTPTTWAKIHEYCPIIVYRPRSTLIKHSKVVGWDWVSGVGFAKFAPYYDGIEVDGDGVPLKPRPLTYERANKAAIAVFNANVRIVRDKLRTRMLVGEWDNAPTEMLPTTSACVKAFEKLAAMDGWIDHDLVMPLFHRLPADVEPRSCRERFEHLVRYARQSPSLRETYEKECF